MRRFAVSAVVCVLLIFSGKEIIGYRLVIGPGFFPTDIINSQAIETDIAFTPDGRTLFFSRRDGEWGQSRQPATIFISHRDKDNNWLKARAAPFSGAHDDTDPFVSLDGRWLYFISTRPTAEKPNADPDIWRVAIKQDGFGVPERLPEPVNSPGVEYSPVTVADGALYFASTREGGMGEGDLYRAEATESGFAKPENLGPSVNSRHGEWNLYVSPEEDLLIFEGSGRADNVGNGSGDLYAALKVDGKWALTRNLRHFNSAGSDLMPRMFPNRGARSEEVLYYARANTGPQGIKVDVHSAPVDEVLSHFDRLLIVSRSDSEVCSVTVPAFVRGGCAWSGGRGPHEIAVSPDHLTAFVPNYGVFPLPHGEPVAPGALKWTETSGGEVDRISLEFMRSLRNDTRSRVLNCNRPHGVETDGNQLWVTCEDSGTVHQLSLTAWWEDEPAKILSIDQKGVHEVILSPDGKTLVTANQGSGSITLIDLQTEHMTTLKVGKGPEGMAFAPGGKRLFVLNAVSGTMSVVDMAARKVVKTVPTGGRFPIDIAVSAKAREIWISHNASRDLTILDLNTYKEKQKVDLGTSPLGLILSDDEQWAFVTVPRRNEVWAYDTRSRERRAVIPDMFEADGLAFVPAR